MVKIFQKETEHRFISFPISKVVYVTAYKEQNIMHKYQLNVELSGDASIKIEYDEYKDMVQDYNYITTMMSNPDVEEIKSL